MDYSGKRLDYINGRKEGGYFNQTISPINSMDRRVLIHSQR